MSNEKNENILYLILILQKKNQNQQNKNMKNYLLTLTLMLFSFSFFSFNIPTGKIDYKYESTVIINIKKHTSEEIQTAHDLLLKNNTIIIDYQCLVSGVIVFKISHNYTHEADVKPFVYKALSSKIPVSRISILFVDIHSKINQC